MRGYRGRVSSDHPTLALERLRSQRVFAGALIGALVVIAVVVSLVLGLGLEDYPSPLVAAGLFLLNVLAFGTASAIGYRTPAIAPGTDEESAEHQAQGLMQQTMITRFAITEFPAILALAGAFLTGSAWVYLIGAFWAVLSMAWHIWPSRRVATKLAHGLEREGVRSHLTDVFDQPASQQH